LALPEPVERKISSTAISLLESDTKQNTEIEGTVSIIQNDKHNGERLLGICLLGAYLGYFAIGSLAPGHLAGKVFLLFLLGGCAVFATATLITSTRRLDTFVAIWTAIALLCAVHYALTPDSVRDYAVAYQGVLRTIAVNAGVFFPPFYLARTGRLRDSDMLVIGSLLIALFLASYLLTRTLLISLSGEDTVNNTVYGVVYCLPFLAFVRRAKIAWLLIVIATIIVASSFKRGAAVTLAAGVLAYLAYEQQIGHVTLSRKMLRLAGLTAGSAVVLLLLMANNTLVQRFGTISSDQGSSRFSIFSEVMTAWTGLDLFSKIVGLGSYGSVLVAGNLAHNDFLEFLIDYGLIGITMYAGAYAVVFRRAQQARRRGSAIVLPLQLILVMWLLDSQYQQWYFSLYVSASVIVLGFALGHDSRERRNQRIAYTAPSFTGLHASPVNSRIVHLSANKQ
jgi:hypothetical protein